MDTEEKRVQVRLTLPEPLHHRMRVEAVRRRLTLAQVLELAVKEYNERRYADGSMKGDE